MNEHDHDKEGCWECTVLLKKRIKELEAETFSMCIAHAVLYINNTHCPYCRIKELEHDIDSYREIDREHLKRIAELEQAEYVYAGQIAEYGVT